ncbi:hypothetical protein DLM86_24510 [Paenibacillus flagellatus]|uniref:Uncharacterized protein n=2 Tax=Paenibacillus flagellatus TaxID=2211139 RepID=A0A2V5JXP8_9BACL|nr:hypothetical protein DLM86_24510 [Paenibacillus flagellatus]
MRLRSMLGGVLAVMLASQGMLGGGGTPRASAERASGAAVQAVSGAFPEYGEPIDLGSPIQTPQTIDAAYGQEDGANVVYTTVSGSASSEQWAVFNVIDIDRGQLLGSYPLEGTSSAWAHVRTPDGRVFIGASKNMFVYSPVTKTVTNLGVPLPGTESIWALAADENGNVYGGIYSASVGGRVFRIDAKTLAATDVLGGKVDDGTAPGDDGKPEDYVRSLAYYNGYVYAGTGSTNGRVWRIDPTARTAERIELPGSPSDPAYGGRYDRMGAVYGMTVVGSQLFAFFNGPFTMHVYDLDRRQWRDKTIENVRGLLAVTPEHNGKVYTSKKDKFMWEIDTSTLEERPVMPFDGSIRSSAWMNVANVPDFPGTSMVTISYDGKVVLYDPPNGKSFAMRTLVEGQANNIQALERGPDGKLYMSSYMGTKAAQYDPASDTFRTFALGQAEGIGSVGDTLYYGVYPKAEIFGWNTKEPLPETSGPAKLFEIGEEQDRPFVLREAAGKLLIGTIPGYSTSGGALTVYDPAASAQSGRPVYEVFRNIVAGQSITGLAYRNGLVYGSTSIHGGLGGEPAASKAKLFVWDMATKTKLREWEPQADGLGGAVPLIGGLTIGPDGLVWGAANGVLFAFDPDTYELRKQKNVYPDLTNYGRWRPAQLAWGQNGYLYANLGGRLTIVDPYTLEHRAFNVGSTLFALDLHDNVYVAYGTRFAKLPLLSGPSDEAVTLLSPKAPANVPEGSDVTLTVRAKEGLAVRVTEGEETVARFVGQGPVPVTVVLPSPAVGAHRYALVADPQGGQEGVTIPVPAVTVHAFDGLTLAAGKTTLLVGETAPLTATAVYGPVTVPVGTKASFAASPADVVALDGASARGMKPGEAIVTATYNGRTASVRLTVRAEGPEDPTKVQVNVPNAGFEQIGPDGTAADWTIYSYKEDVASLGVSEEQARSGSRSFKVVDRSTSNSAGIASAYIPVEPGATYEAHAGVFLGNPPPSFSSSRTVFWLRYYDAQHKELPAERTQSTTIETPRGRWLDSTVYGKAPAQAAYARIILLCSTAWVATAYYDDIRLYKRIEQPVNTAPTITPIAAQYTVKDTPTDPIAFTVGDKETPDRLTIAAASSNPAVVPVSGIALSGEGAARTVRVTPAPGATGRATVTLTVGDGERTADVSFDVYVVSAEALPLAEFGNKRTFDVSWSGGPPEGLGGVKLYYSTDGGVGWSAFGDVRTSSPVSFTAPADGAYLFAVRAVDAAGREERPPSRPEDAQARTIVDTTAPLVVYSGNAGTYALDERIAIACSAVDELSGVASSTCTSLEGPAYRYIGHQSLTAEAVDRAGNVGTGTAEFTVYADLPGLLRLLRGFVTQEGVADALAVKLEQAARSSAEGRANAARGQLNAFLQQLSAQTGKSVAAEHAELLGRLARDVLE